MMDYAEFIASKARRVQPMGFEPTTINAAAFDWQADICRWAIRRGRAAIFEDCGLGKTLQELIWSENVVKHTNRPVILHCPIGVRHQSQCEAEKFGIDCDVHVVDSPDQVKNGINLVNYEKLHKFDPSVFAGVVLDESSILKSLDGKTRRLLTAAYSETPYRLAASATPAPNDYMEIGNQAEWLGIMRREEMLSTFFVHDGGETSKWRLKGHARDDFWEWMATWCVFMRSPSDLGYDDDGFKLPPLTYHDHILDHAKPQEGMLFAMPAKTLTDRRAARKETMEQRIDFVTELVGKSHKPWVIWCNLNAEGIELTKAINGAVEIAGRHSDDYKEQHLAAFGNGGFRVLVTKPRICGFGMNWQHCNRTVIFPSDSWEQWYQMVRRFWRYGQTNEVAVHCVVSELETAVLDNIRRKEREASELIEGVVCAMRDASIHELHQDKGQEAYTPSKRMKVPSWLSASNNGMANRGSCTGETVAK